MNEPSENREAQLNLEIQRLKRENAELKKLLQQRDLFDKVEELNQEIKTLRLALTSEKSKARQLERRLVRERNSRKEAETIMERKSRDLYLANEQLTLLNTELEEEIRTRTFELQNHVISLERANKELKQFTYLASHDLKTPLRAIGSLVGFIESDVIEHPELYKSLQDCIDLIKARVTRMHRQLNGILEYSNIGKYKKQKEPLWLIEVTKDVISDVILPEGFSIEIEDELFILNANRHRIYQILRHIIENAVKYNHEPEKGQVIISSRVIDDKFYQLSIRDNGPGIHPKYHEKIFQIFQTLETKDRNKESIGIGLPIVKKIIEEEMNGTIHFESNVDEGTNFIISWDKSEIDPRSYETNLMH